MWKTHSFCELKKKRLIHWCHGDVNVATVDCVYADWCCPGNCSCNHLRWPLFTDCACSYSTDIHDSIILMYVHVMPAICLYFVFMPHIFLNKSVLQSSIYRVFLRFMSWGAVLWWLTLVVLRLEHSGRTGSIPWLLMAWLLVSPGHQQSWYWLIDQCIKLTFVTFVFHKQGFQLPVPYPG